MGRESDHEIVVSLSYGDRRDPRHVRYPGDGGRCLDQGHTNDTARHTLGHASTRLRLIASKVRALPGAPFPKEFADLSRGENRRRMFIEQSDQSRKFAPQLREYAIGAFLSAILRGMFFADRRGPSRLSLITGLVFRRSLASWSREWHCCGRERAA